MIFSPNRWLESGGVKRAKPVDLMLGSGYEAENLSPIISNITLFSFYWLLLG